MYPNKDGGRSVEIRALRVTERRITGDAVEVHLALKLPDRAVKCKLCLLSSLFRCVPSQGTMGLGCNPTALQALSRGQTGLKKSCFTDGI